MCMVTRFSFYKAVNVTYIVKWIAPHAMIHIKIHVVMMHFTLKNALHVIILQIILIAKCQIALSADVLKTNCINCHMPALPTKAITVQVSDTLPSIQFYVHTHHIAIYPEQVKKILAYANK